MTSEHLNYLNEKKYANNRLPILFIITFFSFIFWEQATGEISKNVFSASVVLAVLSIFSLVHYAFIVRHPYSLNITRKMALLISDLISLTFIIAMFGHYGLFLFPLYIIIVMQSGLYFGSQYFYVSLVTTSLSWIILLTYSVYWSLHSDIIATFAITIFLIPLFYLNYIVRAYEKNDALYEELSIVSQDANYDSLTGVANRKTYVEEIKKAIKEKEFFALLFIDLNKFKLINDNYGHYVGDEILKEVTYRLNAQLDEHDFLARLGGDEFVIISRRKKIFLPKLIKNIENNVIGDHTVDKIKVQIELSIGISMYPDDDTSAFILAKYADDAMYAAKKSNVYHLFYKDITENKSIIEE